MWDEVDEKEYPGVDNDVAWFLHLIDIAECGVLTKEGEEYFEKYDTMMRTHKVPDSWK